MSEEQYAYKSKFADPTHPMFNGGLVGFVSGGNVTRDRRRNRDRRRDRDGGRRRRQGGPISGVISLVGAAANAAQNKQPANSQGSTGAEYSGTRDSPYIGKQQQMPMRDSKGEYYDRQYQDSRTDSLYRPASSGGRRDRDERRGLRRFMQEDVVYLMVVNMPSEEELAQARRILGGR